MRLVLKIVGRDVLDDGSPSIFVAERGRAVIGRSLQADWRLPDPRNEIAMLHCEIAREDGGFVIIDRSTSGTLVNGVPIVLGVPHRIDAGDQLTIGTYELEVVSAEEMGVSAGLRPAAPDLADPEGGSLLLRHLLRGLLRLMEARARTKAGIGIAHSCIEPDGSNPLKVARTADGALEALTRPPQPGCMSATHAIDDAFLDLQAHEVALMTASHAALDLSIRLFSPAAIRAGRKRERRWWAVLFPALYEATLWRQFERAFEGAVHGKDETLRTLLATEFRQAYERHLPEAAERRPRA